MITKNRIPLSSITISSDGSDGILDWDDSSGTGSDYNILVDWVSSLGFSLEDLGFDESGNYQLKGYEVGDVDKPCIFIVPNQHGWEDGGAHIVPEVLKRLKNKNFLDKNYKELINTFHFYAIVSANPWGYENGTRDNSNGVNLNRNWDYNFSGTGVGEKPFSEKETQIIRDKINEKKPIAVIDHHSWGDYDYSSSKISNEEFYEVLSSEICNSVNFGINKKMEKYSKNENASLDNWARNLSFNRNTLGVLLEIGTSIATNEEKAYIGLNFYALFCMYLKELLISKIQNPVQQ